MDPWERNKFKYYGGVPDSNTGSYRLMLSSTIRRDVPDKYRRTGKVIYNSLDINMLTSSECQAPLAQLVRASALCAESRGFDPLMEHIFIENKHRQFHSHSLNHQQYLFL